MPHWSIAFAIVVLGGALGCAGAPQADYGQLNLVNASGTVKLDGTPLEKAVVTFDAEDGQFSYGLTDSSGNYTLQLDTRRRGSRLARRRSASARPAEFWG